MRLKIATTVVLATSLAIGLSSMTQAGGTKEVVATTAVTSPLVRAAAESKMIRMANEDTTTTEAPRATATTVKPHIVHTSITTHRTTYTVYAANGWSGPWICISHYESGGNPAENTGNGYYGGLQFLLSTWYAHGGIGRPDQASIAEQEAIANRVVAADSGSYREWSTAARCGLPHF